MTTHYLLLKERLQTLSKNPHIVGLLVNVLILAIVLLFMPKLPPQVPLFYGQPKGEEQLAANTLLFLPCIIAIIFIIINFLLGKVMKDAFLQQVLLALTIGVTLLSTITVVKIVFLVGNL